MIQIKNVSKIYKTKYNEVHALKDINLSFGECGLVFILGKSGCGKSTLLNILGGLDSVTSGEVLVDNKEISKLKQSELDYFRNYNVGFIFQGYNLVDEYNVYENIELALDLQGEPNVKEKISTALGKVDLEGYEKRKIKELSGGQQQRVAIARALVKNSTYILADEPTGNLDSATSEDIFTLLKQLSKEKLIIVVSHDRENAEQYGDRIIEMKDGVVLEDRALTSRIHGDSSFMPLNDTENTLKIGTKRNKTSVKQIFKFASRNMWHRWIRLSASILLCIVSLTALILSIATADQYNVGLAFSHAYKDLNIPAYIENIETYQNDSISYNCKKLTNEAVNVIKKDFVGYYLPIYSVASKNSLPPTNITTIDETAFKNFGMQVQAKNSNLSYYLPQKVNEVAIFAPYFKYEMEFFSSEYQQYKDIVYSEQLGNKVSIYGNYNFEVEAISYITFDICAIFEQICEETKLFYKKQNKPLSEDQDKRIAYTIINNSFSKINYIVSSQYINEIYPNQQNQTINFDYEEKLNNATLNVNSSGYLMPYNFAKKHMDYSYYKNAEAFNGVLQKDEMLISLEFAKALLTTTLNKNYQDVTEQEVKAAIDNDFIPLPRIKSLWGPNNIKILGYYTMNNCPFVWKDTFDNPFESRKHTKMSIPPFLMSEYYDNLGVEDLNIGVTGCIVSFDKLKPTEEFFNTLAKDNETFVPLLDTQEWINIQTANEQLSNNKMIYGYISLGLGFLTVIVMFSYILTVIKDSKRKIGVLRSVGMNSFSIAVIYLIEAMILGLISALIAIPVAFGISSIDFIGSVSRMIIGIKTIFIGAEEILAALGTSLLIAIVGAIIPIIIYSKKTPIQLMRDK